MNTPVVKPEQEKAINYTPEMVAILKAHEPLNLAIARKLEKELDRSYQSIIAKCGTEGIEYQKKPTPTKKPAKVTKVELVAMIEKQLDRGGMLDGLEKATSKALLAVLNGCQHLVFAVNHPEDETE